MEQQLAAAVRRMPTLASHLSLNASAALHQTSIPSVSSALAPSD
jgi:hypothetical protein